MPIIIHQTSVSPPARAAMIVAELLGLEVVKREVNLPLRDHFKPEYLEKNPLHTVPLLDDGELVLADSHAIVTYLVSKYGGQDNKLYPKDIAARAIVDQRLYFDATVLFPALRSVIYSLVRYRETEMSERQTADILECYDVAEKYLSVNRFMAADYLTVADISCVTTLSSLNCIVPIDKKYLKVHGWWDSLKECGWYADINDPGLTLFHGFMKQFL